MLNIFKLNTKNFNPKKLVHIDKQKDYYKDFPVSTREWNNSIYLFNKSTLSLIPQATIIILELIKSYLNIYNLNIERKLRKTRFMKNSRRLSSNKIYVSNGELKHTNQKLIVSLYTYNRQRYNYLNILRKRYLNFFFNRKLKKELNKRFYLIKYTGLKHLNKTNNIKYKLIKILHGLKNKDKYKNTNINFYLIQFYKKWVKKSLKKIKLYLYFKQLLYVNKSKYDYKYLQILKNIIQKIYNKNVEFNLVNIKYHYLNSDILSESITLKITKNRGKLIRYFRNLTKKIKVYKTTKNIYNESDKLNLVSTDKVENLLNNKHKPCYENIKKFVLNEIKYKKPSGFKLKTAGRLSRRYTASRSMTKLRSKGNLINADSSNNGVSTIILKNNLKSNLQYSKSKSQTRVGSFGIKCWISGN